MEKTKKIDIAIIVVFLAMLILPHVVYFFVEDMFSKDNSENRNLAVKPNLEFKSLSEFPNNYDNYFNDNLPFRKIIQRAYNNISYYLFNVRSLNNVIIGKQTENGTMQWLFYNKKSDGNPIQYAMGTRSFTEKEKDSAIINIKLNTQKLEQKNMKLYYFIAPNKSTVYKELLPNNIKIKNQKNIVQEFYEYIKSQNIENIVYPYNELIEAKKTAYCYSSLDTHWNLYGGFIGTSLLQNKIDPTYNYLFSNAVIRSGDLYDTSGDLSRNLNISSMGKFKERKITIENFLDDKEYSVTQEGDSFTYINENPLIDKEILIIGDSFSDGLSRNFIKMYSKITYLPFYMYSNELLEKLSPDIVIIEAVERNIDNIINFFII